MFVCLRLLEEWKCLRESKCTLNDVLQKINALQNSEMQLRATVDAVVKQREDAKEEIAALQSSEQNVASHQRLKQVFIPLCAGEKRLSRCETTSGGSEQEIRWCDEDGERQSCGGNEAR